MSEVEKAVDLKKGLLLVVACMGGDSSYRDHIIQSPRMVPLEGIPTGKVPGRRTPFIRGAAAIELHSSSRSRNAGLGKSPPKLFI